jgi:hypothetical protein
MPFNGSGTFTIVNTFVPNTTILSAAVNQNFTDIATGLSDCLTRDGQAGMSAVFKAVSGSVSAPGISFNSDATAGLYLSSTGIVGLVAKSLGLLVNSAIYQATSATVQAGGSGYAVGDTITETGGTAISNAVFTVATLSGSAVATVTVGYPGNYTVVPSNPVSQGSTSGLGTGCTLNITFAAQFASSLVTNEAGALPWQRLGSSSFVSGLMALANGKDFVTGLGASNVISAIGLSAPPPGASFKNLVIKVATTTTATVAADYVVVTNGTAYQTLAFSSTINFATTGANALDTGSIATSTWYAIWVIAKPDGTTAGLASTSATSPTMPSGYTYKARVGWVRSSSSVAQLYGTWQFGRRAQYVLGLGALSAMPQMINAGSATYASASVSNFVPTTASEIYFTAANATVSAFNAIAPNNGYATTLSTTSPPPFGGETRQISGTFVLESTNVWYVSSSGTLVAFCNGWVDNL